ncbi:MAG: cellulose synthase/poly-beta-1,6-N-acetylglucosamine synthase-like glycosyltransferase [Parvicellaceae bacterium]|jgi:cellulose synthase/poly-beta-1,6-N-acetylglucosamine synthase-like glycosyltransferase
MEILFVSIYVFFLTFILLYALMELNLLFIYLFKTDNRDEIEPGELPFVTVQLPIYNELYVVERLIDACANFNYPKDKFEIQMLDDSNDETVEIIRARVKYWSDKGIDITHVIRPERVGYKAGALKYGMTLAKGEFITIFDADFEPDPDFLIKTLPYFQNPKIGVVQTRWKHSNENYSMLTKLQAFALDAHFTIEQSGRNKGGHFINFNGTAGVWRTECIIDAGGWQADTLTEDLDLSYRAQMRGWKFQYLQEVESPAELPITMGALKSQQFRWAKGAAECTRKNLGKMLVKRGIGLSTKIMAIFHLFNSFLFICIVALSIMSVPLMFILSSTGHEEIYSFLGIFMTSTIILGTVYYVASTANTKNRGKDTLKFLLYFPAFLSISMSLSLYNAIGVIEGYLGKKSPFVRTPKFNVDKDGGEDWKNNKYLGSIKSLSFITWLEASVILYFLFGLVMAIRLGQATLIPFYAMLIFGFSYSLILTIRHTKYAR